MNKNLILILTVILITLLGICLIYADRLSMDEGVLLQDTRNADGSLTFSVRTATYNGPYAPRNSGVIWITNSANQFIKTLKVWAIPYRWTLVRWVASSNNNVTGAITGASLNSHQLHNVTWNARNYSGTLVPDGTYTVNVEFTEHNATTNNPGKYKTVAFSKSIEVVDQTIPNETYFRDMHLTWTPIVENGSIAGTVTGGAGNPISGAVIMAGTQTVFSGANGAYNISLAPGTYDVSCIKDGYHSQTQYGVNVVSSTPTTVNFDLSPVSNDDATAPEAGFILKSASPNPFRDTTNIRYYLPQKSDASLSIYNLRGQKVNELSLSSASKGWNEILWNGRDFNGLRLPAGTYFYGLQYQGILHWQKLSIY